MSSSELRLPIHDCRFLLGTLGPSLGLWRAAEVAALRTVPIEEPVLDIGCGNGLVTSLVLPRIDVGVDPDDEALARAAGLRVYRKLVAAPLELAALPAEYFSTAISNSVLEHVGDVWSLFAAAARLLRPAGRLVFTVPTPLFTEWLLIPSTRYHRTRNQQLLHLNLWPAPEWAGMLRAAGFEVEKVVPYLRHDLVTLWDALEVLQGIWIGDKRLAGIAWRHLPNSVMDALAWRLSHVNFASQQGGGQLIVARKRG